MRSDLFLVRNYAGDPATTPLWYRDFQLSFHRSLLLDRHYLFDIENHVCIATLLVADRHGNPVSSYDYEYLRLILVRDYEDRRRMQGDEGRLPPPLPELNFRELPVALLRLHFAGHDRFVQWLQRIPEWDKKYLYEMMHNDGHNDLKEYFTTMLDYCFCSFERTLWKMLQWGCAGYAYASTCEPVWPACRIFETLQNDEYWRGFPFPPDAQRSLIWLACVWRIHISRIVENYMKPWRDDEEAEWVCYRLRLFRDTHLDLLTAIIRQQCYDDVKLSESLLYTHYPGAHRVCCAEELPCLVSYTFDNFKTGSSLKERCSLRDRIGHIVTNKPMPNICKVRNVHKIIKRYGNSDKVIFELIKHIAKCILLGNLPHARGSLDMMARIRVNMSFLDDVADAPVPAGVKQRAKEAREEAESNGKKKKKKKKTQKIPKSKKKKKKRKRDSEEEDGDDEDDEEGDEDSNFTWWLYKCRHFVLFILKEFLFYTAETSRCFDEILSRNNKWLQYKEIVRAGMGKCRDELSRQCRTRSASEPIDWTSIEYIYKKDDYDIKTGIIMKVHTLLLKTTEKVKKDSFENILMKKMTSIEEDITFSANDNTSINHLHFIKQSGVTCDTSCEEGHVTLDQIHFIAWTMAMSNRHIMETRWFQVVGMTERGLRMLREWIFCYYEYDIPDNALKKCIAAFQKHSMNDYIILKTMIKLIIYYKKEYIFHLPSSYAVRQLHALRRLLCLEPLDPTPPLLGVCYNCPGCLKFANHVINPFDYDTPIQEKDVLIIKNDKKVAVPVEGDDPSTVNWKTIIVVDPLWRGTCPLHFIETTVTMELTVNSEEKLREAMASFPDAEFRAETTEAIEAFALWLPKDDVIQIEDDDEAEPNSDDDYDSDDDENIRYTNKKKKRGRKRKSKTQLKKMYANNEITTKTTSNENVTKVISSIQHDQTQQQQQQNIPYFNTALYDMNTGALHCQRNYKKKKGLMLAHTQERNYVIIKGKRNGLVIESNIDRSGTAVAAFQRQFDAKLDDTASVADYDDDEEDDGEDCLMTFDHENELFFMPDEALNFNDWDVANRLTHDLVENADGGGGLPPTPAPVIPSAPVLNATGLPRKMNNNKTIISRIVGSVMHQKYTCASRLVPIDMIGVIVNGKALCVYCGCMTEVHNTNFHSFGITCMRHALPTYPLDHPVWSIDKFTAKHLERNALSTQPSEHLSVLRHQSSHTVVRGFLATANDASHAALTAAQLASFQQRNKGRRQIEYHHPNDIVNQPVGDDENTCSIRCRFCCAFRAVVYVPVMTRQYKLYKEPVCFSCKHLVKPLISRNNIQFVDYMASYVAQKNGRYNL